MAKLRQQFLNETVGKALGAKNKWVDRQIMDNPYVERATLGILQKGWRALLFANRKGLTPKILGGSPKSRKFNNEGTEILVSDRSLRELASNNHFQEVSKKRILIGRDLKNRDISSILSYGGEPSQEIARKGNQILIINPCVTIDDKPDVIILQNRPPELEYQPQSSWADIKSMGRNTPFYHYTGSETSLHINVSWYLPGKPGEQIPDYLGGGEFNPFWVINQCRKLEAWTMANGYAQAPPVLMIRWGSSDLFRDFLWILKSATYRLRDFHDRYLDKTSEQCIDQGLIPYSATQELIFQRVSGINLWYNDIMPQREATNKVMQLK